MPGDARYRLPDEVQVEAHGPVRIVRLNRPEQLNASNPGLHGGLVEVWGQIAADPEARAVVLTGAGRAFSAGGDMDWFGVLQVDEQERRRAMEEAKRLVREMVAFPLPVVAALNGPAVGLGCSLAVLADIVLMTDTAFFADPHVSIGLVAGDGGVLAWPLLTSLLRAKEYIFTGDKISADQAVTLGLANRVVPGPELMPEAMALAERLAALPARALQDTKRALNLHLEKAMAGILDFAIAAESECFVTAEHRASVARFRAGAAR
jgi:enoyl-CoA hydratase